MYKPNANFTPLIITEFLSFDNNISPVNESFLD